MYTLIQKLGKRATLQRVKGTLLSANSEIHERRDRKEAPFNLLLQCASCVRMWANIFNPYLGQLPVIVTNPPVSPTNHSGQ